MKELFTENTIWIGLLASLIVSIILFVLSLGMNKGNLWRIFAIVFFLLFFVLPLINELWNIF